MRSRNRMMLLVVLSLLIGVGGKGWLRAAKGPSAYVATGEIPSDFARLAWEDLWAGEWNYGQPPIVPERIAKLNGRVVRLDGYLLPLHVPALSSQFFMSRQPRGCYFCSPPGVSEVVQVNIAGGKPLGYSDNCVQVYGRLKVATGAPTDQVLYTINDAILCVAR